MARPRLTIRIDLDPARQIGPGKIRLLEAIGEHGSISRGGQALGMSYRRAWLLVDDMNRCFRDPVVEARPGGARGGGATLTPFGQELIHHYRAIEAEAHRATGDHLARLRRALAGAAPRSRPADVPGKGRRP